jgi:acetolactate synthase I/II/III large subunit
MNGAESLVHTLLKSGVDTCFANPGTSEMHFVAALDRIPGMRCVLCLFEGVVTGAADGYARATGKPAATLLHCGPGLGNGLANLHNARRASTPMVNIVGDQATYHRPFDPPLTADTEGWARGVSGWVRTASDVATVGADAAAAAQAAQVAPGQIATLILPSDTSWNEGGVVAEALPRLPTPQAAPSQIDEAAAILRQGGGRKVALMIGYGGISEEGLQLAHRIGQATGCRLMADTSGKVPRGRGRLVMERVPYVVDAAVAAMAGTEHLILCAARKPVTFFAYPGKPQTGIPETTQIHVLARKEQDPLDALRRLADALHAPPAAAIDNGERPRVGSGPITPESFGATVAALIPEGAVVADESITYGRGLGAMKSAAPHDWMNPTGGAIGGGMPLAVGAAVGSPGRRVINLQADGSGMYTVQSLWTQGRERLDVTTVILSNRKYQILLGELANVGANPGRTALEMMDLGNPDLNWQKMAEGMGVEAARTDTADGLADLMASSLNRPGPFLIELIV